MNQLKRHRRLLHVVVFTVTLVSATLGCGASTPTPSATNTGTASPTPQAWPTVTQPDIGARHIAFLDGGWVAPVTRTLTLPKAPADAAASLLTALLEGPTDGEKSAGLTSAFPAGTQLAEALSVDDTLTARFEFPDGFAAGLDARTAEWLSEQVWYTVMELNYNHVTLEARGADGAWRALSDYLPKWTPPKKPAAGNEDTGGRPGSEGVVAVPSPDRPTGPLTGKTIYVSAGHGWLWSDSNQRWYTQRPPYQQIIEDHQNAEVVNWYIVNYLANAGADVWTVRERDFNPQEIIVDNDQGAPTYTETGAWTTSSLSGYNGGSYRYVLGAGSTTATATWTPGFNVPGVYAVYAWFKPGSNRVTNAHYQVHHAGGVEDIVVSQEVHGSTWRYLGSFYFKPGLGQGVTLLNDSPQTSDVVIADAIRFGGGFGPSGYQRYEEASLYFSEFMGFDTSGENDVVVRPHYAEWERVQSDDPVYISWHTNGYDGSVRGTESYIHDTEPTPGSSDLQYWVHTTLIDGIRQLWEPGWVDRGRKSRDLGEVRELSTMPGVLIELAFHDNADDAAALKEPVFEQISARAIAQGVVKYYAARDGRPVELAPETPEHLRVRNSGYNQVRVSWDAPPYGGALGDPATSYRVYRSADGLSWDSGTEVGGSPYVMAGVGNGETVFVRVTAVNAGGESFPTEVLGARQGNPAPSLLLIVWDFNLLVAGQSIVECTPQSWVPDCTNVRMRLDQMNNFSYVAQHAAAIPGGYAFDSTTRGALLDNHISLTTYTAVDWLSGVDYRYRGEGGIDAAVQAKLIEYLNGGGALLLSGSEVAWDLVSRGLGPDFYHNWLRAEFVADDAGTYQVTAAPEGALVGLGPFNLDDGGHGTYNVRWPDRIAANAGATPALKYEGGTGGVAAIQYAGSYRLMVMGFPLEAVYPDADRQALTSRALTWLLDTRPRLWLPLILGAGTNP